MKSGYKLLLWIALAGVLAFALVGCKGVGAASTADKDAAGPAPFSQNQQLVVPAGSTIYVRLQQSISSSSAQAGQNFSAVLDDPLLADGKPVAQRGTEITGRVVAARQSGHIHNAGYLRLTLISMKMNGKDVPLQTRSIFIEGGSYKKRNLAFIGGSAGGGALLGALVGGGKGALIGSAIGAAGGTTAAYATGKKEVGFAAERRIGFRLNQPLVVDSVPKLQSSL